MDLETADALLGELRRVQDHVIREGAEINERWQARMNRAAFRGGATNLAHYLALRRLDLRPVEAALRSWGLASLASSESHVLPTLTAIIANLEIIAGANATPDRPGLGAFRQGSEELARNTEEVLGPSVGSRRTRILVTLGPKAAKDLEFVRGLVAAGMDCARINCAHDGPDAWAAMIGHVRAATAEVGRTCRVMMDLAGPKIRTATVVTPAKRGVVKAGDSVLLTFAAPSEAYGVAFQASCSSPDVLRQVSVGARVSIKDGLIQGRIGEVRSEGLVMEVLRTPPDGQELVAEKGINFPDTDLVVTPLTDEDLASLDFACANADVVSYSFVQRASDVALLQNEILRRRPAGAAAMPIVAKIETRLGFASLPEIIIQAAGANPFAVMIARGDLAEEVGYERLSEVQEEILWLCEAAHVPVIWATQVLESLVERGMPSRGEFTDAAMAERAECVMLNKGPYITEGIAVLDDVLSRMETHRVKRATQLRPLKAWDR